MADGTVVIDTELDSTGVSKGVKDLSSTITKGMGVAKTGFVTAAKGVTALAGSIAGLSVIGGKYDGELQQTAFLLNRLDQTTQDMIDTNSEHARGLGMTSKQYKDCAASTGTFMKSMGMSTKQINSMLPKMVELTANGAAFANVSMDEAMNAVSSAAMGNYEALGALNIEMSDALINESSYAKSLGKTTQKMSMSEKTQAIYNTMLERGGHLSGFAASEADSFSTSLQVAKSKAFETAGSLGQVLLPVMKPIIDKFIEMADKVKIGADTFRSAYDETGNFQDSLVKALDAMGIDPLTDFVTALIDLKDRSIETVDNLKNMATEFLGNRDAVVLTTIAIGTLTAVIVANYLIINSATIAYELYCTVMIAWETVTGIAAIATGALGTAINSCIWPVTLVIVVIGILIAAVYMLITHWDTVAAFLSETWASICSCGAELWSGFSVFMSELWEGIKQLFFDTWNSIVVFFTETLPILLEKVISIFQNLPNIIGQILGFVIMKIIVFGVDLISNGARIFMEFITTVGTWLLQLPANVFIWLGEVIPVVLSWGGKIAVAGIQAILSFIGFIGVNLIQLPFKFFGWICECIPKVMEWGGKISDKGIEAMEKLIKSIWNTIKNLPERFIELGADLIKGIWEGITSMGSWIANQIGGFCDGLVEGAKKALGIASPSKVMKREVGVYVAQGIGAGFEDETANVTKNVQNKLKSMVGQLRTTIDFNTNRPTSANSVIDNSNVSNNTVINFNRSVESPYETYKAVRRAGRDLGFA